MGYSLHLIPQGHKHTPHVTRDQNTHTPELKLKPVPDNIQATDKKVNMMHEK